METVAHLWNVNQVLTKLKCPLTTELQTFYMQKCKSFKNEVELPKQKFGPSMMCIHCGSHWNTMDYQARIIPGRKISKSIKRIIKCMNEGDQDIPKVRVSLAQKAMKNEMNKLAIKCSVCSKQTVLPFKKKDRLKPAKDNLDDSHIEMPQSSHKKKKKKKSKDKTAGLNISGKLESPLNKKNDSKTPTKPVMLTPKINTHKPVVSTPKINTHKPVVSTPKMSAKKILASSTKKAKKLNIVRLRNIVNDSMTTPTKNKNLRSFLAQLC
ncbi:uncharacterized protein LOC116853806 [Odontomachus brunneus]|uniref:uncharacterized protein LOC116853806 n=1 Tax=Odontomachus brunneus TaxID=486640 RepID=UPI0013F225DA|nr:uncharacterized protein LOC116853806 [Odontomachus brunneus]